MHCISLCFSRSGKPTDRFSKKTACHLIQTGQLYMSWGCLAFPGTRQSQLGRQWCCCPSHPCCAHCCYFSPPRHYRAPYLLIPRKTSAIAAAAAPALVSGNLFLSPPACEVPRRSPAVKHFIADFFGKAWRSHKRAAFLFCGRRGAFLTGKKKKRKEKQLKIFPFSVALCELKNLKTFTLTIFWVSLRSQSSRGSVSAYYSSQG